MSTDEFHEKITELDKVEGAIKVCINSLYSEDTPKEGVAYILEMTACAGNIRTASRS